MKTKNLILLGLVAFGAYYFLNEQKKKNKTIAFNEFVPIDLGEQVTLGAIPHHQRQYYRQGVNVNNVHSIA